MPKDIKGSETEKNLLKTFAGESQARNRYTFWASVAKKEGLRQISEIFEETSNQEKEHAKRMFKFLDRGEPIEITACYPAGKMGRSTLENLKMAAEGEHEEWSKDYPLFADIAEKEGFMDVAKMYRAVSVAEKQHEARYLALAKNLEEGKVFRRNDVYTWRCINCGYLHEDKEAPAVCPACLHPQAHFEILSENW